MSSHVAEAVKVPDGADAKAWHFGYRTIETRPHEVGGFKVQAQGIADQTTDGELQEVRIQFLPWKKSSYFEESEDMPELTAREARQLAHVLLALAEEVDGWVSTGRPREAGE